jgi:type II secretory pathway pseudopilin PulG
MILAVKSWRLRAASRAAMGAGQFEQALELAEQAQEAQRTAGGKALQVVTELLGKYTEPLQ